jgi:hypothetical protein
VDRPTRAVHRHRDPESGQPRDRVVQIDVTFILPRRLVWLLAGIAIGTVDLTVFPA